MSAEPGRQLKHGAGGVMRVMRFIRRAAVLSLLVSYSSVAGAQEPIRVFTYLEADRDTPYGRASRELNEMLQQRRNAATAGNCTRKSYFDNQLRAIDQNPNSPFWQRYALDPQDARRMKDSLHTVVANPLPCPLAREDSIWRTGLTWYTGNGSFTRGKMPERGFLGAHVGSTDVIPLFVPDRKVTGESFSISAKSDISTVIPPIRFGAFDAVTPKSTYFKVGFSYEKSDADQSIGTISPGAGNRLLIPSPQAGGFSLGGFPANVVQGAHYSANYQSFAGRFTLGQSCNYGDGLSVGGYSSLGYRHTNFDENFDGGLPGFNSNFGYVTNVNIDQVQSRFGFDIEKVIRVQAALALVFGAFGEIGVDIMRANGLDRLFFTGFPDSSANLSKNKSGAGFSAGGSVGVRTTDGVSLGLAVAYESLTANPVIERNGVDPSKLDLKRGDTFSVSAQLKVPIGATRY